MYISRLYMFQIMDLNHFEILYSEYLYYSKLIGCNSSTYCGISHLSIISQQPQSAPSSFHTTPQPTGYP